MLFETVATFDPAAVGEPGLTAGTTQARTVEMQVEPDLVVQADAARLRQILLNLVANAVKYSAPGTLLVISATLMTPTQSGITRRGQHDGSSGNSSSYVRVGLKDHGLGVPPAEAHTLFQRFVRLQRDIAGPVRGTGVGLYLSRTLVEAMGGRIWVESTGVPGEGSTFYFTVPAVPHTPSVESVRRQWWPCDLTPDRVWTHAVYALEGMWEMWHETPSPIPARNGGTDVIAVHAITGNRQCGRSIARWCLRATVQRDLRRGGCVRGHQMAATPVPAWGFEACPHRR